MDHLIKKSLRKIRDVNTEFKRYLYSEIEWADRLIIIKGARGVGKTTLMVQYIKETYGLDEKVLYVSLDDIWFSDHSLIGLAEQFAILGGTHLFLDEIHKYRNWSQEVKNIYDDYPDLRLVLTGSSFLHIYSGKGDLSRRAISYDLHELSLREFLILKESLNFPRFSLNEILSDHQKIAAEISSMIKPIRHFHDYLNCGAYPYVLENEKNYHQRLLETVNTILENDLPAILNVDYSSVLKLKKLLYVVATSAPFKPNIAKLSEKTGIARDTLLRYLQYLTEAKLLLKLYSSKKGIGYLTKPEKIYLHNTNLMKAFADDPVQKGALRETFFYNQVSRIATLHSHKKADFLVDGRYIVEIGGKNKTKKQIQGLDDSYIVLDDLEIGYGNKIPLWLFGFLY